MESTRLALYLVITGIIVVSICSMIFLPFFTEEDYNESPFYFFDVEYNSTSHDYIITISKEPEKSSYVNDFDQIYMILTNEGQASVRWSHFNLYELTQGRNLPFRDCATMDTSKPFSEQEFTNLSLSIIFVDDDGDNLLSVGDHFIMNTRNVDTNESIPYSEYILHLADSDGDYISDVCKLEEMGVHRPTEYGTDYE
jgi:hypothetical protein